MLILLATLRGEAATDGNNVTFTVESLGIPLLLRWPADPYARNVWDLHLHQNKIHVGCGNSSNNLPSPNAGPVAVAAFDLTTKSWGYQGLAPGWNWIPEEQIDRFVVIAGVLLIPGHDPQGLPSFGNFYYRDALDTWHQIGNLPNAVHCYDLLWRPDLGTLFAALGTGTGSLHASTVISTQNLITWNPVSSYYLSVPIDRTYEFVRIGADDYAVHASGALERLVPASGVFVAAGSLQANLFPPGVQSPSPWPRLHRPVEFNGETVYIAGVEENDHQVAPLALCSAPAPGQARLHKVPCQVRDLLVADGRCYALANAPAPGAWRISVWSTGDLNDWQEDFFFIAPSFARSFEWNEGDFYLGLGCETAPLSPQAGEILRVPSEAWQAP